MPWPPEDMWAVEARFRNPKKEKKMTETEPKVDNNFVFVGPPDQTAIPDVDPGVVTFQSGAKRSKYMAWFTFVPKYFIQRIAAVFQYGAKKYGIRNWQKGDQEFIDEIPDHIINHVYEYIEEVNNGGSGKDKEDHLANIGCNLVMLMHFQREGKFPQRTQG
jgi:Domain of unknown function (DUF5664)